MLPSRFALSLLATAAVALLAQRAEAQFVDNTTDIPQGGPANHSRTENVDFGDVDLDGDWDAVFADGGDGGNDRNRIWVNQGGNQGGAIGFFLDETAQRFPTGPDQSRDIDLADIDADGDLDVFVSNTSSIQGQANRWWVNLGGTPGGTIGFYDDETATRWVGLGGPGSSVSPTIVLASGGFITWSCDSDFGDVDNDGDLDLVTAAYGGAFSGKVPTRVFLNDGSGYFREFNPSGFQLSGTDILDGSPGLWCEGVQTSYTTISDGTSCDVATTALDVDLGDVDGDFDLDILLGSRLERPRLFANRLDASALAPASPAGGLGFRDVTGAVFPPNYVQNGSYEQELGDLDGDGDLDLYGASWANLADSLFENDGNGVFLGPIPVPGSSGAGIEADFFDYDSDGDLDVYTPSFTGQDHVYQGTGSSVDLVNVTNGLLPPLTGIGTDADCCDVDGDGDYDVFVSTGALQRNYYVENVSNVPDTHAPYVPNVEQAPDRSPGAAPTVIRAHVYDNAPYYITWFDPTRLEVSVDGGPTFDLPMSSSAGQVFRGEIPGYLCGSIEYRVVSEDEHGNQGASATSAYTSSGPCDIAGFCSSTPNSTGSAAHISSNGAIEVAGNALELLAAPVPDQFGLFFYGIGQAAGGAGTPFGNGLLCVGGTPLCRLPVELASGGVLRHAVDFEAPPEPACAITPGSTWHFQAWFRDPAAGGQAFDLSDGLTVRFH